MVVLDMGGSSRCANPTIKNPTISNCSSQLQHFRSFTLRYATVRRTSRACCDLPFNRRSVTPEASPGNEHRQLDSLA